MMPGIYLEVVRRGSNVAQERTWKLLEAFVMQHQERTGKLLDELATWQQELTWKLCEELAT